LGPLVRGLTSATRQIAAWSQRPVDIKPWLEDLHWLHISWVERITFPKDSKRGPVARTLAREHLCGPTKQGRQKPELGPPILSVALCSNPGLHGWVVLCRRGRLSPSQVREGEGQYSASCVFTTNSLVDIECAPTATPQRSSVHTVYRRRSMSECTTSL
jgi:hypothetical protein